MLVLRSNAECCNDCVGECKTDILDMLVEAKDELKVSDLIDILWNHKDKYIKLMAEDEFGIHIDEYEVSIERPEFMDETYQLNGFLRM